MRAHVFAGQPLDRLDADRPSDPIDPRSPELRIIPVAEGSVLIVDDESPKARFYEPSEIDVAQRDLTLLGKRDGLTFVSIAIDRDELERLHASEPSRIVTIRSAGQMIDRSAASIVAYAQAMSAWQTRSRYCGACGAPARLESSGHRRLCTSESCGRIEFPRTDPSVIGIVSHDEACLLVNQPQWPEWRFATIAGFVEPGESLEEAMAREIHEEVGLEATSARYHSSQPWPFPMSLMIGFEVEVSSMETPRLSEEIRAARWFTREQLREELDSGKIGISTPLSISFALIAEWYGDRDELAQLAVQKPW